MPIADFYFPKRSPVPKDFALLKKAPSLSPSSYFSYVVNGNGALLGRFGKSFQFLEALFFVPNRWEKSARDYSLS